MLGAACERDKAGATATEAPAVAMDRRRVVDGIDSASASGNVAGPPLLSNARSSMT